MVTNMDRNMDKQIMDRTEDEIFTAMIPPITETQTRVDLIEVGGTVPATKYRHGLVMKMQIAEEEWIGRI